MEDEGEISDEIEIVEFDDNVAEPAFEEPTAEPDPEPTEVEQARVFELLFFYQCCHLTGCDTFLHGFKMVENSRVIGLIPQFGAMNFSR